MAVKDTLNIVQIGANDGKFNDPIYDFVRNYPYSTNVVLVEPLEEVIPYLKQNYEFHPSHQILNTAVSKKTDSIKLWKVKEEYWDRISPSYGEDWPRYRVPTGVTTSEREKLIRWVDSVIEPNCLPADAIDNFEVKTHSPTEVLNSQNMFTDVDLLQVDTEGMDDEIVYAFFDDGIRPNIINMEDKRLDKESIEVFERKLAELGYNTYKYKSSEQLAIKVEG